MFPVLVAKVFPLESFKCTISKPPKCLSTWIIWPTLPMLLPPVMKAKCPGSFLKCSITVFFSRSYLMVSPMLISGWGYLIVLESLVTMYGTLLDPTALWVTLRSLNLAYVSLILFKMNLPFTS